MDLKQTSLMLLYTFIWFMPKFVVPTVIADNYYIYQHLLSIWSILL